jgi:hypothetical protein
VNENNGAYNNSAEFGDETFKFIDLFWWLKKIYIYSLLPVMWFYI